MLWISEALAYHISNCGIRSPTKVHVCQQRILWIPLTQDTALGTRNIVRKVRRRYLFLYVLIFASNDHLTGSGIVAATNLHDTSRRPLCFLHVTCMANLAAETRLPRLALEDLVLSSG
jgi:hypothetical protein